MPANDPDDELFLQRDPIPTDRALSLLTDGTVELLGRMPYSSNATFLSISITTARGTGHL